MTNLRSIAIINQWLVLTKTEADSLISLLFPVMFMNFRRKGSHKFIAPTPPLSILEILCSLVFTICPPLTNRTPLLHHWLLFLTISLTKLEEKYVLNTKISFNIINIYIYVIFFRSHGQDSHYYICNENNGKIIPTSKLAFGVVRFN